MKYIHITEYVKINKSDSFAHVIYLSQKYGMTIRDFMKDSSPVLKGKYFDINSPVKLI